MGVEGRKERVKKVRGEKRGRMRMRKKDKEEREEREGRFGGMVQ